MNKLSIYTLKALRMVYTKLFNVQPLPKPACVNDPDKVSQIIYDKLMDDKPCMIARFGSTELTTMVNYLGVKHADKNIFNYIRGKSLAWWWNDNILKQMQDWSGFFPPTHPKIEQFCELMFEDMKELDVLGSWLRSENYIEMKSLPIEMVSLICLEPYLSSIPWSKALTNKKVLVVHPFANLIEHQFEKRTLLFEDKNVLTDFHLSTIKAVQSLGAENNEYVDWFQALKWMKDEIDKKDYDICLIGCGAYGFPLAAHVKRMGKKAVHLGGALQLLFGIKGNRWEDENYATSWNLPKDTYISMFNNYWVKPTNNLKPKNADNVEGACYW